LRQALQDYDDNDKVVFAYNYGDHQRTTVCAPVRNIDQGDVTYSEYHRMGKLVEDDGDDDGNEKYGKRDDTISVVVLNIA
jgi:hypothetical protein